jgi:hypothetical protein
LSSWPPTVKLEDSSAAMLLVSFKRKFGCNY